MSLPSDRPQAGTTSGAFWAFALLPLLNHLSALSFSVFVYSLLSCHPPLPQHTSSHVLFPPGSWPSLPLFPGMLGAVVYPLWSTVGLLVLRTSCPIMLLPGCSLLNQWEVRGTGALAAGIHRSQLSVLSVLSFSCTVTGDRGGGKVGGRKMN